MDDLMTEADKLRAGIDGFANEQRMASDKTRADCGAAIEGFKTQVGEWAQKLKADMGTAQAGGSSGKGMGGSSPGRMSVERDCRMEAGGHDHQVGFPSLARHH